MFHCESFDSIHARRIPNSRLAQRSNRPVRRDSNLRLNNIFRPIAFTRRDVPRQYEVGQGRERNVLRPANSRFQHTPAPHRNSLLLAEVVIGWYNWDPHHLVLVVRTDAGDLVVDNLNATTHVRTLLTDLFLLDEAAKISGI